MKASSMLQSILLTSILLLMSAHSAGAAASEIVWVGYTDGFSESRADGKPMLVDFYTDWCVYCIEMEETTYVSEDVLELSDDFVMVKVNGDSEPKLIETYGIEYYPTTVFLMPDGTELDRVIGYMGNETMVREMEAALADFQDRYDPERTDYPPIDVSDDETMDEADPGSTGRAAAVLVAVSATVIVLVLVLQGKRRS